MAHCDYRKQAFFVIAAKAAVNALASPQRQTPTD